MKEYATKIYKGGGKWKKDTKWDDEGTNNISRNQRARSKNGVSHNKKFKKFVIKEVQY